MINLLSFQLKPDILCNSQASLSDTIRMALYQKYPALFELFDYDNDLTFLEPTLFCQFLSDIDKSTLIPPAQCLLGYIPVINWPMSISAKADRFGLVNLPNLGYVRANPHETFTLNPAKLDKLLIPNQFLPSSSIRLCWHPSVPAELELVGVKNNVF